MNRRMYGFLFTALGFAWHFHRPNVIGIAGISDVDAQQIALDAAKEATLGTRVLKWKRSFALFVYVLLFTAPLAVTLTKQDFAFQDSIPLQHPRFSAAPLSPFNDMKVAFHLTFRQVYNTVR